ncbi:125aa long hypothetical protein [Pyrococcus horikoshii OT3]|uniref:Uncharacterized protein n=1 Tax=Pyrococcus horikoshii (strain ATCC 700860 / DSM 12428 / JCM 9974 / NBRC 100139 / OT-3) TaxID=70601 RepID=O50132_PYRHO|nr:125aa long hypothetical protein [Pyrococcus horikoshii OT3]
MLICQFLELFEEVLWWNYVTSLTLDGFKEYSGNFFGWNVVLKEVLFNVVDYPIYQLIWVFITINSPWISVWIWIWNMNYTRHRWEHSASLDRFTRGKAHSSMGSSMECSNEGYEHLPVCGPLCYL